MFLIYFDKLIYMHRFNFEKRTSGKKSRVVGYIDEAGRGSLAGPVVAACVVWKNKMNYKDVKNTIKGINDSKKLSKKQREYFYKKIIKLYPFVGVGIVDQRYIDKNNILQATFEAMRQAINNIGIVAELLIVDGQHKIPMIKCKQRPIIHADSKIASVSAASIVAKRTRDMLMLKYHKKFPQYCFNTNQGYGTKAHFDSILQYGPCQIHRLSFSPFNMK